MRRSASAIVSREAAYESRRYPSPCSPNAVPPSTATPACSSRWVAISFEGRPSAFTLGKT